jgi:uncharacterized protein (TIGR02145 family)
MRYIFSWVLLLVYHCATAQKDTIKDIDSNVYKTVKIGNQVWMAENLKTAHYRDGSPITEIAIDTLWANAKTGAWCYYQSNPANNPIYGKLYNWYAVADTHHLCPTGWHVPMNDEWTVLTDYLGGDTVAGGKMKAMTLWKGPNTSADNSSGFSALPAGSRYTDGNRYTAVTFYYLGNYGCFWSSTEGGRVVAFFRSLDYRSSDVYRYVDGKGNGLSVRCVGD